MKDSNNTPLITTIKEHCRICYTCVRECPAKAIRITDGQAEVIPQRCIGCGNCVRICSQNAKKVADSTDIVKKLLAGKSKAAAILAPSFPAEFVDIDYKKLVGMLRKLGFDYVNEVAFGADLVAKRYKKLLDQSSEDCRFIATSCPAIIAYVERYHPDLVGNLAPIVSPMVATARVLNRIYGDDLKVVFIGPCIAKKGEVASVNMPDELDAALTFVELRAIFNQYDIKPEEVEASEFNSPLAGKGVVFPVRRGLFQAADITEDIVQSNAVAIEGGSCFIDAFKEFESGNLKVRLLEVLACSGCISGPGMSSDQPLFRKRTKVSEYAKSKLEKFDYNKWQEDINKFDDLDLSRRFKAFDQRIKIPQSDDLTKILNRMGKFKKEDELNCGACGYNTCREHAVAIFKGLAENEMCLPFTIERLHKTISELATSNNQLASAQEALMQSEKLASMGQLAAGIAHEVNNPLGVVLMYAHLLLEQYQDNPKLREDLVMVAEQADRCKKIVSGLLDFARRNKVMLQPTDIDELIRKTVRSFPLSPKIEVIIDNEAEDGIANIDRDQIAQVLTNLISNAEAAMNGAGRLTFTIKGDSYDVIVEVADTGCGIPEENISKIFEPFFTTKEMGKGTGLGLAVTYGIIKMHRGNITVRSNADSSKEQTGTVFKISLPRNREEMADISMIN